MNAADSNLYRASEMIADIMSSRGYLTAAEVDHLHEAQRAAGKACVNGRFEPLCGYCAVARVDLWPAGESHAEGCPCREVAA